MKKLYLIVLLLAGAQLSNAQIKALTDSGNEVILYEDGTWKYVDSKDESEVSKIRLNNKEFYRDRNSTFLLKSKKVNIGIWLNSKIWSITNETGKDAFEYQFKKKGEDLYAMLITEKINIPIEQIKSIAIENAKEVSPDVHIIKEEYRIVNGIKILVLQMAGTIKGINFTYYGYYYSNSNGTVQLITYTSTNLFNTYLTSIELFLNGLVLL